MENLDNEKEYRSHLAEVLRTIRKYQGTEKDYRSVMDVLIKFEKWLADQFGEEFEEKGEERLTTEQERKIAEQYHPASEKQGRTIDDLLALTQHRLDKVLKETPEQSLLIIETDDVFLPPGKTEPVFDQNETGNNKGKPLEERLRQLIAVLQQNKIFTDDLVAVRGKVTPEMARETSYTIIEIPRINREILVCDQHGEATFVIRGILSRDYLSKHTKKELQTDYRERVVRVVYREKEQWEQEIVQALLSDAVFEERKIDVADEEKARQAVIGKVPTAEEWAAMQISEKKIFRIGGKGLKAIARVFGVSGDPSNKKAIFLELGREIYGEHEALASDDAEIPENWLSMRKIAESIEGVSPNTVRTYLNKLAAEHPELGKKKGNLKYFHPDVLQTCKTQFEGREDPPEGWMTMNAIADSGQIERDYLTIEAVAKELAAKDPSSKKTYKDAGGHMVAHYSPELIKKLQKHFTKVEKAPEGWKTCSAIQESQDTVSSYEVITNFVENYRTEHPEWFHDYLDSQNNVNTHLHPDLVKLTMEHFGSMEKAPAGWQTRNAVRKKYDINYMTLGKYAEKFRAEHPEWFHNYLDARNQYLEHLHPDLIEKIRAHFQ